MKVIAKSAGAVIISLTEEELDGLSGKSMGSVNDGDDISLKPIFNLLELSKTLKNESHYISRQLIEMSKMVKNISDISPVKKERGESR